jgi:hypothetical protein
MIFHSSDHLFFRLKGNAQLPTHGVDVTVEVESPKLPSYVNEDLKSLGLSVDFVKQMLRRENELRLSESTLTRYKTEGSHLYVPITEEIQLQVCQEFNLSEEIGLIALRCADSLMPTPDDLAEIKEISFYRKYNRMRDGNIKEGEPLPPICFQYPFHTLDSQLISIEQILSFPRSDSFCASSTNSSSSFNTSHKSQLIFTDEIINIVFASSIS